MKHKTWISKIHENFPKIILAFLFVLYALGDRYFYFDDLIQNLFYKDGHWILEDRNNFYRLIFYDGIKYFIYISALSLLIFVLINFKNLENNTKQRIGIVLSCMALIPLMTVGLKFLTRIDCPYHLKSYGGEMPTCHVFRSCSQLWSERIGSCFPAGHASGGFALISFRMLRRKKLLITLLGLSIGFIMSTYQMIRGAHFFGHTLTTMMLSFLIIWLCEFYLKKKAVL